MGIARTPRHRWVEAGLEMLGTSGPEAVRVESLARTLGVTKGGFYGYFTDRASLLVEILDTWERRAVTEAIEQAEREGGDALTRALRAADLTFSRELLPVDLAIRDWSRRDPAVAARLTRVDNQRMDYLRAHFGTRFPDPVDLEARCLLAFCAAVASDLVTVDHRGHTRDEIIQRAADLLFAPTGHAAPPDS